MKFTQFTALSGRESDPRRRSVGNEGPAVVVASSHEKGVFAGERVAWGGDVSPVRVGDHFVGKMAIISGMSPEDAKKFAERDLSVLEAYVEHDDERVMRSGQGVKLYVATGQYGQFGPAGVSPISSVEDYLSQEGGALAAERANTLQELVPLTNPIPAAAPSR